MTFSNRKMNAQNFDTINDISRHLTLPQSFLKRRYVPIWHSRNRQVKCLCRPNGTLVGVYCVKILTIEFYRFTCGNSLGIYQQTHIALLRVWGRGLRIEGRLPSVKSNWQRERPQFGQPDPTQASHPWYKMRASSRWYLDRRKKISN